ncbi:MAG: hypothetical protein K2Q14_06540 [Gammaproteobacteria bacterium]|nr:hypothetical protein [Gammaproteobacteria bacterium]
MIEQLMIDLNIKIEQMKQAPLRNLCEKLSQELTNYNGRCVGYIEKIQNCLSVFPHSHQSKQFFLENSLKSGLVKHPKFAPDFQLKSIALIPTPYHYVSVIIEQLKVAICLIRIKDDSLYLSLLDLLSQIENQINMEIEKKLDSKYVQLSAELKAINSAQLNNNNNTLFGHNPSSINNNNNNLLPTVNDSNNEPFSIGEKRDTNYREIVGITPKKQKIKIEPIDDDNISNDINSCSDKAFLI